MECRYIYNYTILLPVMSCEDICLWLRQNVIYIHNDIYIQSGAHEGKERLTHYCMCSLTDQGYSTYWNTSNFLIWKVL